MRLPTAPTTATWIGDGAPVIEATLNGHALPALLDTGYPRSAIGLGAAEGLDPDDDDGDGVMLDRAPIEVAGAAADAVPVGLILDPALGNATGAGGVIGGDLLHQLPFVLDARARTVEFLPAFADPAPSSVPLGLWTTGRCFEDGSKRGAEGPHALLVVANLEGTLFRFVVDTGASATLLRSDLFGALGGRPRLEDLRARTGFAGTISATATRARTLAVGRAETTNGLILSAPEIDRELDRLEHAYGPARCVDPAFCPAGHLDGFLGWSFLREHRVDLTGGTPQARALTLTRFESQDHWRRELIGIGIYLAPSTNPRGQWITGFLSNSPARDAGLAIGDVITSPLPDAMAPGDTFTVQAMRGATALSFTVTAADLLPNP